MATTAQLDVADPFARGLGDVVARLESKLAVTQRELTKFEGELAKLIQTSGNAAEAKLYRKIIKDVRAPAEQRCLALYNLANLYASRGSTHTDVRAAALYGWLVRDKHTPANMRCLAQFHLLAFYEAGRGGLDAQALELLELKQA
jgi:hypothetical protein